MERGIAIVIIGMLWGYLLVEPLRRTLGSAMAVDPRSPIWPLVITRGIVRGIAVGAHRSERHRFHRPEDGLLPLPVLQARQPRSLLRAGLLRGNGGCAALHAAAVRAPARGHPRVQHLQFPPLHRAHLHRDGRGSASSFLSPRASTGSRSLLSGSARESCATCAVRSPAGGARRSSCCRRFTS